MPEYPDEEIVSFTDHLRRRLPLDERVLDAGCGRGRNAFYLSQAGFQVFGFDVSSVAVEIARTRLQQWNLPGCFQVANLLHAPYQTGSFAAAVCVHVLPYHSKSDLIRCVQELRRVVRPGGLLYFDLLGVEDAAYGGGQPVEPNTFLNLHDLPIHFSPREEIDELLEGFAYERILHLEIHTVFGSRSVWGVWAVKNAK